MGGNFKPMDLLGYLFVPLDIWGVFCLKPNVFEKVFTKFFGAIKPLLYRCMCVQMYVCMSTLTGWISVNFEPFFTPF